ncbi:hypothetical protein SBA7_1750006 [Candidatus Sulfotelmatobacter sp. SbA7]|nr:hypothetical protein SBA7_1750006 [Candidatus Sulfotelmatobacter sp. SbA7]
MMTEALNHALTVYGTLDLEDTHQFLKRRFAFQIFVRHLGGHRNQINDHADESAFSPTTRLVANERCLCHALSLAAWALRAQLRPNHRLVRRYQTNHLQR